jgi:pilus assembly protein CpaB
MAPSGQGTEGVVVATVNLVVGETVTSKHVRLSSWPKADVPKGAFGSLAEVEGWVARNSIVIGEPLLKAKLVDPASGGHAGLLPMLVPEGLRGVTIKVDKAVEESGFVQPNSRVDVLVSMTKQRGAQGRIAKMILQNVPVLAAGQTVEMQDNKPVKVTTVTLALTPEQAERLALAQTEGRLMLATRNIHDDRVVRTVGVTRGSLLGQAPSAAPKKSRVSDNTPLPPPKVKSHAVSVLRGGRETDYKFIRGVKEPWSMVEPRR